MYYLTPCHMLAPPFHPPALPLACPGIPTTKRLISPAFRAKLRTVAWATEEIPRLNVPATPSSASLSSSLTLLREAFYGAK